jgi:hypothetical protein
MDNMSKGGVAVGLATISVVLAALVFAAEKASNGPMEFIERHLGFSPDSGDGSTEILVAGACRFGSDAAGEVKRSGDVELTD